jgi:hypothetical protein
VRHPLLPHPHLLQLGPWQQQLQQQRGAGAVLGWQLLVLGTSQTPTPTSEGAALVV